MDGLVAKKFDLKQRAILTDEEHQIRVTQADYGARNMLYSGVYVKSVFKILTNSATKIIDGLLDAYKEVGDITEENIAVIKEAEILDESSKLAIREQSRIKTKINDIGQSVNDLPPKNWTGLNA